MRKKFPSWAWKGDYGGLTTLLNSWEKKGLLRLRQSKLIGVKLPKEFEFFSDFLRPTYDLIYCIA